VLEPPAPDPTFELAILSLLRGYWGLAARDLAAVLRVDPEAVTRALERLADRGEAIRLGYAERPEGRWGGTRRVPLWHAVPNAG
jgi:Mn-dependent DtxR family transcriptional regulator